MNSKTIPQVGLGKPMLENCKGLLSLMESPFPRDKKRPRHFIQGQSVPALCLLVLAKENYGIEGAKEMSNSVIVNE